MPMSPRLLRPRQAGGDPDALRYIAAVQAADGQPLEAGVRKAIDAFVTGCKADGIWSAIKASCILAGARTLAGALVPLVGAAPTNNNFVSGDYNRKTGLLGNGTTKYLNSNRNCNTELQDDVHLSVYSTSVPGVNRIYIGAGLFSVSGTTQIVSAAATGGVVRARSRNMSIDNGPAADTSGLLGTSRTLGTGHAMRVSGAANSPTRASQQPFNGNYFVFASNDGSAPSTPLDSRLAFYSIGEGLDLALLDSRVSTLYTAIGAAIP